MGDLKKNKLKAIRRRKRLKQKKERKKKTKPESLKKSEY